MARRSLSEGCENDESEALFISATSFASRIRLARDKGRSRIFEPKVGNDATSTLFLTPFYGLVEHYEKKGVRRNVAKAEDNEIRISGHARVRVLVSRALGKLQARTK